MLNMAVENVGRKVLILRGDEIIGLGKTQVMSGLNFVSVSLEDDKAKSLISKASNAIEAMGERFAKHLTLRYSPSTGTFIGLSWIDDQLNEEELADTRIVDEENLRYGLVPDYFLNVPGYKGAFNIQNFDIEMCKVCPAPNAGLCGQCFE